MMIELVKNLLIKSEVQIHNDASVFNTQSLSQDKSILLLRLKKAENLRKADFLSKSDPFVEVTFQGQIVKTETINNNNSPVWNQKLSFIVTEANLDQYLTFVVYDSNTIMSSEKLGFADIMLKDVFNSKQPEVVLQLRDEAKENTGNQGLGSLTFTWKIRQLRSQQTAFSSLLSDSDFSSVSSDPRSKAGCMKVSLHFLDNLDANTTYHQELQVSEQGVQGGPPVKTIKKKPPIQNNISYYFVVGDLIKSEFNLTLFKAAGFSGQKQIGSFNCQFKNATFLLDGSPVSIELDQFKKFDPSDTSPIIPKAYLTFTYINSFFTRNSRGTLSIKVKSWTVNGQLFPSKYYLTLKPSTNQLSISGKGKPLLQIRRPHEPLSLKVSNLLESLQIQVSEDKNLQKDPQIASYSINILELFGNNEQIVFQEIFHKVSFVDDKKMSVISVNFATKYMPDGFSTQQLQQMGQQESTAFKSKKSTEGLFKKLQTNDFESNLSKQSTLNQGTLEESQRSNPQDPDIFSLELAALPTFLSTTRGLLMLRIKDLEYQDEKQVENQKYYLVFKNSKMIWGEVHALKTSDPFEQVQVKLYNEANNELVAEGQLILKDIFEKIFCWKKLEYNLAMTFKKAESSKISLNLDLQYRSSKFTRIPRGKLEVILVQGTDLKYRKESYSLPIMEFRIDSQRFQIKEELENTHQAKWQNRLITFESQSIWDVLEIRFFDSQKNQQLTLLGSYQRSISSIYLDDDSAKTLTIDLSQINDNLSGFIKLQFEYFPQKDGLDFEKKDIQIAPQQQNKVTSPNKQQLESEALSVNNKKRGVCFLTLWDLLVQGDSNETDYNVENIRIEISYGDQKCLSRVTSDLNKTQNRQQMVDIFRLALDDITVSRGQETKKILVKAFDIDYSLQNPGQATEVLVGQAFIDPTFLRLNQGQEIHYQCSIKISESHFIKKSKAIQNGDDIYSGGYEDEKEIMEMLDEGIHDAHTKEHLHKFELIINFQMVYLSTNFTKNPMGIVTINELTLLNLQNYISDLSMREYGSLYLMFKMNGNKNNTTHAKLCKNLPLVKEQISLFSAEYDPVDVMKQGRVFYVNTSKAESFYSWQKQIVLFTSSPLDQLEIELILEKKINVPSSSVMDTKATSVKSDLGNIVTQTMYQKILLANLIISIADMSYFFDQSATREASIAHLIDFQGNHVYNPNSIQSIGQAQTNTHVDTFNSMKLQKLLSSKDLMNKSYDRNLILLMDCKFSSDSFTENDQLRGLINVDHIFVMPKEVKYDDYINQGFDKWVSENSPTKKTGNESAKQAGKIMGASPQKQTMTINQNKRHMLVEFWLQNLNSILRHIKRKDSLFVFFAFEPLHQGDTVQQYMRSAAHQVQSSVHIQRLQRANANISNGIKQIPLQKQTTNNLSTIKGYGMVVEDFFAPAEELMKLDTQVTSITDINDFEIHGINEMLEAWVPVTTNRVMLSLIVQQSQPQALQMFHSLFLEQPLQPDNNLLGLYKSGVQTGLFQDIEVYQCPIEINSKESGGKVTMTQCQNLAELSLGSNLLQNPISRAQCQVKTKVQTSKFIDTPSGYLNVIIKKMSHNSINFLDNNYLRIDLKSKVSRDKLLMQQDTGNQFVEFVQSEMLQNYKKRTEKNNKTVILVNEVGNFIARHFSDCLVISLFNKAQDIADKPVCLFTTKVELNNLELNEDKMTILVVGTSPMRNKGTPVYYTFELDLLFKPRLQTDSVLSNYEFALQNYKMLKGSDKQLTRCEEEILKMLLERLALGKQLIPNKIKFRKAFFILRNMMKCQYQSIDSKKLVQFRVNPKAFFFNMNDSLTKLSEIKKQQLVNQIKTELKSVSRQTQDFNKYKNLPLEKNGPVEKGNNLVLEFKNNISFTQPLSATQTNSFITKSFPYKKLVLVATQDQNTVYKQQYDKAMMLSGQFLQGTKIVFKNIKFDETLSIRLMVEEETQGISSQGQKQTASQNSEGKLITLGMALMKVSTLELKSWVSLEKTLVISQFNIQVGLTLLYSDFVKNPHKVVNMTFHRIIQIAPGEIVDAESIKEQKNEITQTQQKLQNSDAQQFKIVIKEDPIIQKQMGLTSTQNFFKPQVENKMASSMRSKFSKSIVGSKSIAAVPQDGSINQILNSQQQSDTPESSMKFKLIIEYDNCLEYEGEIKDKQIYEIDQYGKNMKPDMSRITINNTKSENQVIFKLCVDNAGQTGSVAKNTNNLVVIAQAQFSLCELQALPNQLVNLFLPLCLFSPPSEDLSSTWALKNYKLEDLFVLASIKITDKTFGELSIQVDKFEGIAKSLELRDLQWKVNVKPATTGSQYMLQQLMNKDKKPENNEIFNFSSVRIPYDINLSNFKVARDMNIHLQLKDIFSDTDAFLRPSARQLYQDQDTFLVFELHGFDQNNYQQLIGSVELSMIEMIQRQMLRERDTRQESNKEKTTINSTAELRQKQLQSSAVQQVETEFGQCSAKFQKLFQDTYVKFGLVKDTRETQKIAIAQGNEQQKEEQKQQPISFEVPAGYQIIRLKYKQDDQEKEAEQLLGKQLSQNKECTVDMIVKIEWNFSYKLRAKHSDKYFEINEEFQQLERIKQRKNITNILDTLTQVRTVPALTFKNLTTLSLVLASQSCARDDEEDIKDNQCLNNVQKIITVLADLFKENQINNQALIQLMRALTYLKIICQHSQHYKDLFQTEIKKSILIESMIETYNTKILFSDGSGLSSKTLAIEFLNFLSNMLSDYHDLYFDLISGVRLDPLLAFLTTEEAKGDYNLVTAYAKFINSVSQCLFKFKENDLQMENYEKKVQYVKMDLIKISQVINAQLLNLIHGGLSVYKNDYEVLSMLLCQTAIQFVHLAVLKSKIITNDESFTLPDILLNLFKILCDGIISQLSLDFITDLKKRLNYEMSLIKSLDLRMSLLLSFDDGVLMGMIKRTTQHFLAVIQMVDYEKRQHAIKFFEKTKLIFEFFATDFTLNAFAENCRPLLKQILTESKNLEDVDFVHFLEDVVKIDAEIESQNGENNSTEKRNKFLAEKYGNITKVNKFSLSRIEWLDTLYEQ